MKATASILAGIDDITERGNYIESVSQEYVFNRDEMKRLVTTAGVANMRQKEYEVSAPRAQREQASHREKKDPYEKAQKTLLTMMVDDQSLFGKLKGIISLEDFTSGLVPQVAEYVFQRADAGEKVVSLRILLTTLKMWMFGQKQVLCSTVNFLLKWTQNNARGRLMI